LRWLGEAKPPIATAKLQFNRQASLPCGLDRRVASLPVKDWDGYAAAKTHLGFLKPMKPCIRATITLQRFANLLHAAA